MYRIWAICAVCLVAATAGCKTETAKSKAAGNMLFNQGEYENARDEYRKAVAQSPNDPGARVLLGNALVELGDYESARGEFSVAIELSSDSPEAHRGMMTVISHTSPPGDPAAFEAYLGHAESLMEARPKDKNAIIMAGAILSEAANPDDPDNFARAQDQAEKHLKRGLEIDDRDPKLLFHLALVYARKGELEVAERVVERIAMVEPEPGFSDYARAIVLTIAGDRENAIDAVEALLAHESVDPDSLLAKTSYLAPLHDEARFQQVIANAKQARK
jgi:Flp pilus assembly protein TadD